MSAFAQLDESWPSFHNRHALANSHCFFLVVVTITKVVARTFLNTISLHNTGIDATEPSCPNAPSGFI